MNMEAAVKELQDAMIVMAHLEKRQTKMLRDHTEWCHAHDKEIAEYRRRTGQNLAEITTKLNRLLA